MYATYVLKCGPYQVLYNRGSLTFGYREPDPSSLLCCQHDYRHGPGGILHTSHRLFHEYELVQGSYTRFLKRERRRCGVLGDRLQLCTHA